ncbi:glutamyl-tRNA reductase [Pseudolysinimonas sp.]|uniref:glutamyl-tRNA reductase n=1 Tax=Pseudolysinimonas sp. TaxID=2680009 RepID=UPI003784B370
MLFCLTANHRTIEFDVLDRISRVTSTTAADLIARQDFVRGAIVLSTCNRFEAYIEIDDPLTAATELAVEAVVDALSLNAGDDAEVLRAHAVALTGQDVVKHLFAVSSGLESMVLGEEEITGQVQRALRDARLAGTTSSGLELLFQRAAHASREARAQSDLAAAGRSLARLALDLADTRVPDWAQARVLLVGTGSYAATTVAALDARGARDIRVFSATGRAAQFAVRYGVRAENDLREAIRDAEVVITCTARYVVTTGDVPDDARRLIIDLGLPRNVEPAVGDLPGVELLDLEIIGRHASLPDLGPGAHEAVGSAAAAFEADRLAAPAVVALRRHVDAVLQSEIDRARARGGDDVHTEAALRHFAGVLLHGPSVRAREFAAEGRLDDFAGALATLFGIQPDAAPAGQAERGASA